MPIYPLLPWHCYFSIALLQWTSCDSAEPQKPSHMLDTGPPTLSTGADEMYAYTAFLFPVTLYLVHHATYLHQWSLPDTYVTGIKHHTWIVYPIQCFLFNKNTTYIHIYTSKSKNVKVLSVCKCHALTAYRHFWHCALL